MFVYGSSDINILHLTFFRSGKDPLEDLIYTSCTDPIQQPAAVRTPRLYTSPRLCQSLVLLLLNHKDFTLLFVYGSSDINILHLRFFRSGKDPLEDLIYTSCTDPIQQPAAARTPRLYTSPRLCQSLILCLCEKAYKHRV
ncbi:2-hydroxyisoflavanone dehydratase-like [Dorcoceras hygrometricum]|uniref:2-hydroxyisoflavanone dehydratase-like n=1 Tax=Dorcoceras hygrometricum TaxID=472368 RepID=A0A2Z7B4K3_9LAMI|nr:2-hydroxyisoflavanone dehydratase-like [Dorcoceras hygrometricum]